jgi:two-component system NtrC family sensor kinase
LPSNAAAFAAGSNVDTLRGPRGYHRVVRLGLRAQLLVALVIVTVGAIVSVGVIAILVTRQGLVLDRAGRAAALAEAAGQVVELSLDPSQPLGGARNSSVLPRVAFSLQRAFDAAELVVYDDARRVRFPATRPTELASDLIGLGAAFAGAPPHAEERPGEVGALVAYVPIAAGSARGALRLSFAVEAQVDALLSRARLSVFLLGAADALLLLFVGAWILRGVVVRPVLALESAARRVAAGDLEAKVTVRGPGELGLLADAFDRMTASLETGRESLIRSEKLAGIGRLAAGVAHEVGNPLAAILGYVEMLLSDSPERPIAPELRHDVLGRVRAETERIHKTISELLEYARPADELIEPVVLARVIEGAVSLVRAQARGKKTVIVTRLPDGLPAVSAIPGRLTQVFLNLLLNAADATGGEGRVVVDARVEAERVVVAVSDDGPGVPAAIRPRLFEPFFTTKDVGKGTGLGLSVSLAIVERWGGTVRLADSDKGAGARFEVYLLPAATAKSET